jgi:glycosyltransferase involved in cell wall biosynthesis
MKILFINEKGGFFGGVEQNISFTAAALQKRGNECSLIYSQKSSEPEIFFKEFKSVYEYLGMEKYDKLELQDCHNFIRNLNPDVIYLHKVKDLNICESLMDDFRILRMIHDHDLCCPRKHKYFIHNGRTCQYPVGWRCYADLAFLERRKNNYLGLGIKNINQSMQNILRHKELKHLLVGSQYMMNELVINGIDKKQISVLPPCVPRPEIEWQTPPQKNNILFVGQVIRGKGVDLLIESLAHINEEFYCQIVGAGNAAPAVRNMITSMGLDSKVEIIDWVENKELSTFYNNAKVVVVPSRWPEPFGMVGIEAMHHGRPVVGFDVGGISDWLKHDMNGLLVKEQDTKAMGGAINSILEDDLFANRLAKNAFNYSRETYDFNAYIENLEHHLSGGH